MAHPTYIFRSASRGVWAVAAGWLLALTLLATPAAGKTPVVIADPANDARLIRTDQAAVCTFDQQLHRLPDILEIRLGAFQPYSASSNLFEGYWGAAGPFVRLDVVFAGLINPPGAVGMGDNGVYAPYTFGPHPVMGFIELDVDGNEASGGELLFPNLRYLGNAARLGGIPQESHYNNRVARSYADFDNYFLSEPFVDRSGEEFHLSLMGEEIDLIQVIQEKSGGVPGIFEEGETWHLTGRWLHRAHGFEPFAFQCFVAEGRYMPVSKLQFRHNPYSNRTTVSLVFPLRNAANATMQAPAGQPQPNNGCPGDQFSIEEALVDLRFSAANATSQSMEQDEFWLIADWAIETPSAVLNPDLWRVNACLGSAYPELLAGSARFVWSDLYPNVMNSDFNGDGCFNILDVAALNAFVSQYDGDPAWDEDGNDCNDSIDLMNFSTNFCIFDTNYDGLVNGNDVPQLGDMDWNGSVESADINDLILGMLDPAAYGNLYPNKLPQTHGDMNGDGLLDGRDLQLFARHLIDLH